MNKALVARLLGIVSLLIGGSMAFSLPWAWPFAGQTKEIEWNGLLGLGGSMVLALLVGGLLTYFGRQSRGQRLFRKEAMAVVGLSWMLATVLGAAPYLLSGTAIDALRHPTHAELLQDYRGERFEISADEVVTGQLLAVERHQVHAEHHGLITVDVLSVDTDRGFRNIPLNEIQDLVLLDPARQEAFEQAYAAADGSLVRTPEGRILPQDRDRMNLADAFFESQSGFSTTGATVMTAISEPQLVPRSILFWRSSSHFLGGLGIIVLFVAILGQGSAGKALMRAEMPGPSKDTDQHRMQHAAWVFAGIYIVLNAVLTLILWLEGLSWFDALCHAFGTMATGGFSTYDASVGHFSKVPGLNAPLIEYTILLFMVLAGSNFTLLYYVALRRPGKLFGDVEFRTYLFIIVAVTIPVVGFGLWHDDFTGLFEGIRYGLFQVVSVMTTTGYGTHDFDSWNSFGRGILFLLMFVGGCAGSTGGGLKVIRHVLFHRILWLELEKAWHPSVVRPLRLGGKPLDEELRHNILVYFGIILVIFIVSWLFLVTFEPDTTWTSKGYPVRDKLLDCATAVSATLNNIGPGLGTIGATQNYAHFSSAGKLLMVLLMMIGRVEIFAIAVLFMPSFWRSK